MSIDDRDEDDPTPTASPQAKKSHPLRPSSGEHRLKAPCPACAHYGYKKGERPDCPWCEGNDEVDLVVATAWMPGDVLPDTERNS